MTSRASGTVTTGDRRVELAAHTPGPWIENSYGSLFAVRDENRRLICKSASQANACLIAAAPDMLAVLKSIRRPVQHDINQGKGLFADSDLTAIDAAIAKATGQGSPVAKQQSNEEAVVSYPASSAGDDLGR